MEKEKAWWGWMVVLAEVSGDRRDSSPCRSRKWEVVASCGEMGWRPLMVMGVIWRGESRDAGKREW